jgi:Flp pilus assembly protein TadG
MRARRLKSLARNTEAAIAPTMALSLFALVAAGGIAFDYARVAALDTELQSAADQAALAAASQLDGKASACNRANQAARALVANLTRFSNDGSGTALVIATETGCDTAGNIRFYQDKDKATAATSDANANYVEVQVNSRSAVYALTPVVRLMNSGNLTGIALAGMGSAVCKVPPVMICNPQETGGNTSFDASLLRGAGLNLVSVGNGSGSWTPGNFGYLQTNGGSNGANGLREALGWVNPPGDCTPESGISTKPGASVSVTDALNTRFDIYDNGQSCPSGGSCPPSANSVKDLVRPANANGNNACALHNQGWQLPDNQYLPSSATTPLTNAEINNVDAMGYPRDMCHAISSNGSCTGGRIGNGTWDRNAYFRVNYGTSFDWAAAMTTAYGTSSVTRYQVYSWELANMGTSTVPESRQYGGNGSNGRIAWRAPVCSTPGITPGGSNVDRRRLSAAVVNCIAANIHGSETGVPVQSWVELFLVEPSLDRDRTSAGDIYAEVIGETDTASAGAATAGQVVRRDVPYLVR